MSEGGSPTVTKGGSPDSPVMKGGSPETPTVMKGGLSSTPLSTLTNMNGMCVATPLHAEQPNSM